MIDGLHPNTIKDTRGEAKAPTLGIVNGCDTVDYIDEKNTTNYPLSYSTNEKNDVSKTKSQDRTLVKELQMFFQQNKGKFIIFIKIILLFGFLGYVGYAFSVRFGDEGSIRLLVCTVFGLSLIAWRTFKRSQYRSILHKANRACAVLRNRRLRKVVRLYVYV